MFHTTPFTCDYKELPKSDRREILKVSKTRLDFFGPPGARGLRFFLDVFSLREP